MKRYFWLNVGVVFTLLLSLLSPAAAFAEGTEISAGVLLTKAVQSEEGVSLVWETVSNEDVTGKDQSFLLVKNGQAEEIIPKVVQEESSVTKTVYTYVDLAADIAPATEYSIVWNLEEIAHNSNSQTIVKEEAPAPPSTESNNETGESAVPEEMKEEKLLQNSADEDPIAEDESFLYLEALYISENSFHASWYGEVTKSFGRVTKYELYLNGALVKSGNAQFTEHLFNNLTPDTTYQVSVKAFNASNVQVLEETMEVTTFSEPSGETVHFPDAQLTQAIKNQLGIERDIYESDLDRLTVLHAADLGITDLTGLEKAVNLEILYLYFNDISDLTPLAGLTKLVDLDLEDNNITNIAPLSNLTNLTTLWLANNPVTDIQVVEGLTNLEYLYLHGTGISDIQGLLSLTNLTHITLSDTELDLTEGSPVWDVINIWSDAGVYVDLLDDTLFESLELWHDAATEESIHLSWWYSLENEEDYEKEYHFKVYVNDVLYTETTDSFLIVSGLDADTEYEVRVEMYNADEELMFEATTIATTLPAPSGDVVTFADSALEDAIRNSLFIFSGRAIYQSDMERLEHLYAGDMGITDLSGLEYAKNLLYLDLHSNEVEDLTPLMDLPLFSLDISGNPISDTSVLTSLVNLESLFLHYTKINDISFLLDLTYLYEVTLFGIEGLTFAEGTPERAVVDELLELGVVNVYLSEEDYIGPTPVEINVLDITDNSIEIDWTYEGEEEVAYYAILMNQELVATLTDTHFRFTDLLADTSYDIAVAAFDKDDNWLGLTEISVSTLPLNVDEEDDTNEETPVEEEDSNEEEKNEETTPAVKPDDKTKDSAKTETKPSTDKKADGNKLPNTATNSMNFILFGVVMLMAGLIFMRGLTRSSLKH